MHTPSRIGPDVHTEPPSVQSHSARAFFPLGRKSLTSKNPSQKKKEPVLQKILNKFNPTEEEDQEDPPVCTQRKTLLVVLVRRNVSYSSLPGNSSRRNHVRITTAWHRAVHGPPTRPQEMSSGRVSASLPQNGAPFGGRSRVGMSSQSGYHGTVPRWAGMRDKTPS